MVAYRQIPVIARCELCEKLKAGVVEGLCPACALWAQAMDKLCQMPADHPAWDKLLADLGRGAGVRAPSSPA